MCGIAGMFGCSDKNLLRKMLDVMIHRGPDEMGTHIDDGLAVGQTRLSIIDVSSGRQPIYNEEKNGMVICNGEIYNHLMLRKKLTNHSFRTHSDTESILHLYEDMVEKSVDLLDGMFSFNVNLDKKRFLARDPIGIKPLYYAKKDDAFYFASEMKALLIITNNIHEFPPGYSYSNTDGFRKYYSVPTFQGKILDQETATRMTIESLSKAVEKRLMADVPIGVYLSGGLDSSIVTALARKSLPELLTFSVGVEGSSDLEYAKKTAEYLDTNHHQYVYDEDEVIKKLREIIYYLESFDYALVRSAIPNFFVSRLTQGKAKAILAGEGADEVFSGYHYLKGLHGNELYNELWRITSSLHNLNLQRCDRMTMAHSIEGRVPFLDIDLINVASRIPLEYKFGSDQTEKWILRNGFKEILPEFVVSRRKAKFSEGAGSIHFLKEFAEKQISDIEFEKSKHNSRVRSKEELLYFNIFSEIFPESLVHNVGQTKDIDMM
jgi:asparagine synthase (glutamine-hydrolysing)